MRYMYFDKTYYKYKTLSDNVDRTTTITPPTLFTKYAPLKISVYKPQPLNNSKTLLDIFLKLGTNIKHHQMICRD